MLSPVYTRCALNDLQYVKNFSIDIGWCGTILLNKSCGKTEDFMKRYIFIILVLVITLLATKTYAAKKVPILVYHHIDEYNEKGGSKALFVTPENFEKQMIYLREHGFTLLTFEQWDLINQVEKPIFLTFDDGYKDNLNVMEVFQKIKNEKFQPRGTFFVISDFIGWSNRLSASELREISRSGLISVQSHTATHPSLTSIDQFEYELRSPIDTIQKMTNRPVIAIAYPYGSFNSRVVEETKKYYKFGITTTPELYSEKGLKDELYLLPRIYIKYSTTIDEFERIVEGKYTRKKF